MDNYTKEVNGTYYHKDTPDKLISVLERCRKERTRVIFDFGDTATGRSWGESYGVSGYLGRSTGTQKILLLIYNSRSLGGGSLSTDCVLTVRESKGKRLLYSHNQN